MISHRLNDWIYSFHVPLFFILSGYFYRQRTFVETLAKGWRQLLRPMLLTIMIMQLGMLILYVRHGFWDGPPLGQWLIDVATFMKAGQVFGMWFLVALFWGKIWMSLVGKMPEKVQYVLPFILFLVGHYLYRLHEAPWAFFRGMAVPFFLQAGMFLRYSSIMEQRSKRLLVIAFMVACFAWLSPVFLNLYLLPRGIITVLTTIAVPISVLVLLKHMSEVCSLPKKLFYYAGQNTLLILCVHSIIHSWQLDKQIWEAMPLIGNIHFVLGLGLASAECLLLVVTVYLLQKISVVRLLYHNK